MHPKHESLLVTQTDTRHVTVNVPLPCKNEFCMPTLVTLSGVRMQFSGFMCAQPTAAPMPIMLHSATLERILE